MTFRRPITVRPASIEFPVPYLPGLPVFAELCERVPAHNRKGRAANFSTVAGSAGDPGRAIPLYEATFIGNERVPGPDSSTTRQ